MIMAGAMGQKNDEKSSTCVGRWPHSIPHNNNSIQSLQQQNPKTIGGGI